MKVANPPKKCENCGRKSNSLRTYINYRGEQKWVCTPCYYNFTGHEIRDKR